MTTTSDIRAGDVLLFRGTSALSWAIRLFDGGDVNHAAIALGDGHLAEAAGAGLVLADIEPAVARNTFVEVRRRHDVAPADIADVVATAQRYVTNGNRYAYQQIFLLALLGITRRIPAPRAARRLLRSAMDHAAAALNDLIPSGRTRMICSEFVYRTYAEASTAEPNPFLLDIDLAAAFAADDTFLAWALAQDDREIGNLVGASFAETAAPFDVQAAERELNALVLDYIDRAEADGETLDVPPDLVAVAPGFDAVDASAAAGATIAPEPSDDEMLTAMASFGLALDDTAPEDSTGHVAPSFGIGATVATAALKGALQGILNVSVEPNFVTPRDLATSSSLATIGRIP